MCPCFLKMVQLRSTRWIQGFRKVFRPSKRRKPLGKAQGKSSHPVDKNYSISSECLSCGKSGRPRSQCKYGNCTCHSCRRAVHINDTCKSKPQKVHKMEERVSMIQLIHFLLHCAIWAQIIMALKYQSN